MTANPPGSAQYAYQWTLSVIGGVIAAVLVSTAATDGSLLQVHHPIAFVALTLGILVLEWRVLAVPPDGKQGINLSTSLILMMLFGWTLPQTWLVTALSLAVVAPTRRRHQPQPDPGWLAGLLAFNAALYAIALTAAKLTGHLVGVWPLAELAGGLVFTATTWLLCGIGTARLFARPVGETLRCTWHLEGQTGLLAVLAVPIAVRAARTDLTAALLTVEVVALVGWVGARGILTARRAANLPSAKHAVADATAPRAADPTPSLVAGLQDPERPGTHGHDSAELPADHASVGNAASRSILLADIEGYSPRPDAVKGRLRVQLNRLVAEAITAANISVDQHNPPRDEGDGLRVLFEPEVPKNRLLYPLIPELTKRLAAYNAAVPERERMRLRVVVDAGDLRRDRHGFYGTALDEAYGLVNSDELRRCLQQTDGPLILVVSPELYEGIVQQEYEGIDPATYEPLTVQLKHRTLQVWIHRPQPAAER